ncbi:MAG: hypothetical protein M1819_000283 [Sarea resinae]|nr:MAG: hypothetical protein M1819_000283 [Sarea resinae]
MSEYWKSTPKYWCKHCKIYVRDTKLEKQQHEATGKHQGSLKRFLRDIHRGQERDERDKQRAKDEVERLNGVVAGRSSAGSTSTSGPSGTRKSAISPASGPRQASVSERKQQLAQLASMGVAIPDEFRREMAMAGDWQTISERPLGPTVKQEDDGDRKPDVHSIGVRKRKFGEEDQEEEDSGARVRKVWGSSLKTYPGGAHDDDEDLDFLLQKSKSSAKAKESIEAGPETIKTEQATNLEGIPAPDLDALSESRQNEGPVIKREDSNGEAKDIEAVSQLPDPIASEPKATDGTGGSGGVGGGGVVFKKRKARNIRKN